MSIKAHLTTLYLLLFCLIALNLVALQKVASIQQKAQKSEVLYKRALEDEEKISRALKDVKADIDILKNLKNLFK